MTEPTDGRSGTRARSAAARSRKPTGFGYGALLSIHFALLYSGAASAPAEAPELLIEARTGPVTASETAAFVRHVRALPLPGDNRGNALVYGAAGSAVEAMGTMFELTRERALLDRMFDFTDAMLAARNDALTGRVLWTGQRELTWPNKTRDAVDAAYTGTENGDVVAHIAYAALLILRAPALASDPVLPQRARTYVRELDRTIDTFILRWLVEPGTNRYRFPVSDRWAALGSRYAGDQGKGVPWNQQMMLNGGFQRLAECHELLGDDPARVTRYDAIVRASCEWFFSELRRREVNGVICYQWSYAAYDPTLRYLEDTGHAGYDILIWRAFASGRYGITKEMMTPFAHTLAQLVRLPDGRFARGVDGAPRPNREPTTTLGGSWFYLTAFAPELFSPLAAAHRAAARTRPELAARLLWARTQLPAGFGAP